MRIYTKKPLQERFLEKLTKTGGCWIWNGSKNNKGYGQIFIAKSPKRIVRLAHRVSWGIYKGKIPDGLQALHKCDTPSCVNPDHLFLGTQKENIQDCKNKNRFPAGSLNGRSKLTENDVAEIKKNRTHLRGEAGLVAKKYGVTRRNIARIFHGDSWIHI